jgi:hypothetical protein
MTHVRQGKGTTQIPNDLTLIHEGAKTDYLVKLVALDVYLRGRGIPLRQSSSWSDIGVRSAYIAVSERDGFLGVQR